MAGLREVKTAYEGKDKSKDGRQDIDDRILKSIERQAAENPAVAELIKRYCKRVDGVNIK